MKNILLRRGLVCGITILFLGLCITSVTGVNVERQINPLMVGETAWWAFDEGSGTVAHDSSPHGYDGNIVGATWTDEGLEFDGTSDYVDFGAHAQALGINKTDDATMIIRFRSEGTGMLYSMSHTDPARPFFDIFIDSSGKVGFLSGDETCTFELMTPGSYNDGTWHLFELKYYGATEDPTVEIYIDSDQKATKTDWVCPQLDEDYLTVKVGRDSNEEIDYFNGEIDDIKYYKNLPVPTKPPEAPDIDGPSNGNVGDTLPYTFSAIDPDGDDVKFHIDWGDGDSDSTVYVGSGTGKTVDHVWTSAKTYTITAYAEDENNMKGPTSTFQVVIPRSKVVQTHPFLKFLQNYPNLFTILKYALGL